MFRIDGATASPTLPAPAAVSGMPGFFTAGDPAVPIPPTAVSVDWLNMIQEELVGILTLAGLVPSKAERGQVAAAIQGLISSGGVSLATDAETIFGAATNKAVHPRGAAALVANRIGLLLGAVPPTLDTLAKLATAIGNNPNFDADTTKALAARALATLQIGVAGLATGGGPLTDDVTITVAAATGPELNAGTDATKALTPATFGAAGGGDGANGWAPLPGGNMIQWGSITVFGGGASSRDFTISFPRPFLNVCGSIVGSADPQGSGTNTQPVTVEFQAPTIAGVGGRIDSGESNRKIYNRVVRWQAIGR